MYLMFLWRTWLFEDLTIGNLVPFCFDECLTNGNCLISDRCVWLVKVLLKVATIVDTMSVGWNSCKFQSRWIICVGKWNSAVSAAIRFISYSNFCAWSRDSSFRWIAHLSPSGSRWAERVEMSRWPVKSKYHKISWEYWLACDRGFA